MSDTTVNRNELWDSFLSRWPLEKLPTLTLKEYSQAGTQDSFTYWLESKTEQLGSVWGGSSFKFGIYERGSDKAAENGRGRTFGDTYAWYSKYGDTPEKAFEQVRGQVLKVATAARSGDLAQVDEADLGEAIKWKLAFLYQNRDALILLPIYKAENLRAALGPTNKGLPCSSLHQKLMLQRGKNDLFIYGDDLWQKSQGILAEKLTTEAALAYLKERFTAIKEPVEYMAGFKTSKERQLGLVLRGSTVSVFIEQGDWPQLVPGIKLNNRYLANDPRISSLVANAPALSVDKPADKVNVHTMNELIGLCDAYEEIESNEVQKMEIFSMDMKNGITPLNQILYGPPGTGKTYATIDEALKIIDPIYFNENINNRNLLKKRFDELKTKEIVSFVTFHQSFSYEDFVEGLRAETDDDTKQINYNVENGVFKNICLDAQKQTASNVSLGVNENPRIWKISIVGTYENDTKKYCFANGEARVGWGHIDDLSKADLTDPSLDIGSNDRSSLRNFAQDIQPGDILLCIASNSEVGAVGVVQSEYIYDAQPPKSVRDDYKHVLKVNWILKDIHFSILPLNSKVRFTQKTVYEMGRLNWIELALALQKAGYALPLINSSSEVHKPNKPHVLIIDEINRGNISRIFGELITLIEPSKRAGADEALDVVLPYSKKSFSVPGNVYLIGTMNTADRSLAGLDIALRRRFIFKEMPPEPELLDDIDIDGVNIGKLLRTMNKRIEVLLDRDHCLGHAYLMPLKDNGTFDNLAFIFRQQILPLLEEYFFEDWERIAWVLNDHAKPNHLSFVQKTSADLDSLFGSLVANNLHNSDRRWRINEAAFNDIESYLGILGVSA